MNVPTITAKSSIGEFALDGLECNDSIWLRVDNFDLSIKRTEVGITVDVYSYNEGGDYAYNATLASATAFDVDTYSSDEEDCE